MPPIPRPVHERFWEKVKIGDNEECWEWQAYKRPTNGYGVFGLGGRTEYAHRVAYFLEKGEIPTGQMVLHNCDNVACCNPFHLTLGNQKKNMADCVRRGRTRKPGPIKHGTEHAYKKRECRCNKCVSAQRKRWRIQRRKVTNEIN